MIAQATIPVRETDDRISALMLNKYILYYRHAATAQS